jgi:acetyltransferase
MTTVVWRPIRADDIEGLGRFHGRLSPRSLYLRFFTPMPKPDPKLAARLVSVDHDNTEAIVALEDDEIIGVARYYRRPDDHSAEVAVIVADDRQGHGVGRFLLARLGTIALQRGIDTFTGQVLSENTGMIQLARSMSPGAHFERHGPDLDMVIPLASAA